MPRVVSRVVTVLRGPYKSIRYQWLTLPKEWATYFRYRLTGRTWINFYSARLNAFNTMESPISDEVLKVGEVHLDFLVRHGLKPSHRFLDIGCGYLRTARYVVPYLVSGQYVGVEIAINRVKQGRPYMRAAGIPDDRYEIVITDNPELRELGSRPFDVIFAQSVLTHMPESDIRAMLQAIKKNMAPQGAEFYFTFSERDTVQRMGIKDFFHPAPWMRSVCEQYGFDFAIMDDWPSSFGRMARLRTTKPATSLQR